MAKIIDPDDLRADVPIEFDHNTRSIRITGGTEEEPVTFEQFYDFLRDQWTVEDGAFAQFGTMEIGEVPWCEVSIEGVQPGSNVIIGYADDEGTIQQNICTFENVVRGPLNIVVRRDREFLIRAIHLEYEFSEMTVQPRTDRMTVTMVMVPDHVYTPSGAFQTTSTLAPPTWSQDYTEVNGPPGPGWSDKPPPMPRVRMIRFKKEEG